MTIIAHARIAERIDQSPTEQFSRIAPLVPAAIADQLDWATVDLKVAPGITCPLWCDGDHQVDTDGSVAHFGRQQVVTVADVDTQSTEHVTVDLCRIDSPTRGVGHTVIGLDAGQFALDPRHAMEIADALTHLASIALGTNTTPTGRTNDWWRGYAVGLVDGSGVASAPTAKPGFLRRWLGQLAQLREAYRLGRAVERTRSGAK